MLPPTKDAISPSVCDVRAGDGGGGMDGAAGVIKCDGGHHVLIILQILFFPVYQPLFCFIKVSLFFL